MNHPNEAYSLKATKLEFIELTVLLEMVSLYLVVLYGSS